MKTRSGRLLNERAQEAAFPVQRFLRPFQIRDVPTDTHQPNNLSVSIAQRQLAGQLRIFPAFSVYGEFLPVDDRFAIQHLLVIGPELFGNVLRKDIEIVLPNDLGFGFAAEVFQVSGVGQGLPAGDVLGVDAIRQIVNDGAQQVPLVRQQLVFLRETFVLPRQSRALAGGIRSLLRRLRRSPRPRSRPGFGQRPFFAFNRFHA